MKLFMPSARWGLGMVEKKLNKLEKEGWRLKKVTLGCLYELEQDDTPQSRYLFTYSMPGEVGMEREDNTLELLYGAEKVRLFPIPNRLKLWRITQALPVAAEIREKRRVHLQHCYFVCLVCCVFLTVLCVLLSGYSGNMILITLEYLFALFSELDIIGLIMTLNWKRR